MRGCMRASRNFAEPLNFNRLALLDRQFLTIPNISVESDDNIVDNAGIREDDLAMEVEKRVIAELVESAMFADYTGVRRVGGAIARDLASQGDVEGAKHLQSVLRKRGVPLQASGYAETLPRDSASRLPLIEEGAWPTTPIMMSGESFANYSHFLEDARNVDFLSERDVSARLGLILHGPPGAGKSLLAGHVASSLGVPFYVARFDSLISSCLGETDKNIRSVFEYVPARKAVLFLDEIDAITKVRGDRHEVGEVKRIFNTVFQGLDALTDDVIVVAATNHPHLLDPAIWPRFPYEVKISLPDPYVLESLWLHFLYDDDRKRSKEAKILTAVSEGFSGSNIENVALAVRHRATFVKAHIDLSKIILAAAGSRSSRTRLIEKVNFDTSDMKTLTEFPYDAKDIGQANITRTVGVTGQSVSKLLKEIKDG